MGDIKFEIKEKLGQISVSSKGWTRELNIVSWNNGKPKYDIRDWDSDHVKMGKGLTFTAEEMKELKNILDFIDFDKL